MKKNDFKGQILQDVMPIKLDSTDRRILYILSTNCRISNTAIAKALKINREVVAYRIHQMLEKKVITGFFTLINPRKLGFMTHMIYLKLKNISDEKKIVDEIIDMEDVTGIMTFSGKYDLYFDVTTRTLEQFDVIFSKLMRKYSGMIQEYIILNYLREDCTEYNLLFEDTPGDRKPRDILELKGSTFQKEMRDRRSDVDCEQVKVDEIDRKILNLIKFDARAAVKDLAKRVGIAPNAVKRRISCLVSEGVIKNFLPLLSFGALGYQWHMVLLNLRTMDEKKFYSYLKFHPKLAWCMKCIGPWNYKVTVFARDNKEFHAVLSDIRSEFTDDILSFDTLLVFNQHKFENKT